MVLALQLRMLLRSLMFCPTRNTLRRKWGDAVQEHVAGPSCVGPGCCYGLRTTPIRYASLSTCCKSLALATRGTLLSSQT